MTTFHRIRHNKSKVIINKYDLGFVKLTYNILDEEAEKYPLLIVREKNSEITNCSLKAVRLFNIQQTKKPPKTERIPILKKLGRLFLIFVISHSDITCAIQASRIGHIQENKQTLYMKVHTEKDRIKTMQDFFKV